MKSFRSVSKASGSVVSAAASETIPTTPENVLSDTRYTPYSPSSSFLGNAWNAVFDVVNGVSDSFSDLSRSDVEEILLDSKYDSFIKSAYMQRVKDLVDYANNSTSSTLKSAYVFIAKRKLFYPNSVDYEVDYLYCWYDYNHKGNSLEGISLGDFYIQPNTIVLSRYNSNGYSTTCYTSADQLPLSINNTANDIPLLWNFSNVGSLSVTNSDGTLETLNWDTSSGWFNAPATCYFYSKPSTNSIVSNTLIDLYNSSSSRYNAVFGDVLTNVQCLMTNGVNSQNRILNTGATNWYISSFGNFSGNSLGSNNAWSTYNNVAASKAPIYNISYNPIFNSGSTLTTSNVNNYSDYGITYNSDSNQFELDVAALGAALGAELEGKFKPAFEGTFSAQPEIGLDFSDNPNNYIDLVNDFVIDLIDENFPSLPDGGGGWEPPSYPAVNTSVYITPDVPSYETYAAQTVPAGVLSSAHTLVQTGWDLFDDLGLLVVVIPLAIFGLLWKFTGG